MKHLTLLLGLSVFVYGKTGEGFIFSMIHRNVTYKSRALF